MAFLPKRLQSKFDSKLYDSKPQLNPTETLDAIEHALRFYTTLVPSRDIVADTEPCCGPMDGAEFGNRARNGLTHLATLKQQVAELVAFREEHQWRPIETAPTNTIISGDVLLWDGEMVFIGYYADKGWICSFHGNPKVKRPTHWQPLPTSPAAEGGQANG